MWAWLRSDGLKVCEDQTVVIEGRTISRLGGLVPGGAEVVDGAGCTLLPGLMDAHVHTSAPSLAPALRFGVTTELEMQGTNTRGNRQVIEDNDAVAAPVHRNDPSMPATSPGTPSARVPRLAPAAGATLAASARSGAGYHP